MFTMQSYKELSTLNISVDFDLLPTTRIGQVANDQSYSHNL